MGYKSFFCTDIAGSPTTGITGGWAVEYLQNGATVSPPSTNTVTEVGDGFYQVYYTSEPVGELTMTLSNSTSGHYISPDWHEWTKDSTHTTDQVYSRLSTVGAAALPSSLPNRFSVISLTAKQATDITEIIQIPTLYIPLAGISGLSIQCYPAAHLNDESVPAISGTYTATVVDVSAGLVEITIGDDVTTDRIPDGSSSVLIYADIKFTDADGFQRRPCELDITLRRDF